MKLLRLGTRRPWAAMYIRTVGKLCSPLLFNQASPPSDSLSRNQESASPPFPPTLSIIVTRTPLAPKYRTRTRLPSRTTTGFSRTLKPRCPLPPSAPFRHCRPPLPLLVVRSPWPHSHSLRLRDHPQQARTIHLIDERSAGWTERCNRGHEFSVSVYLFRRCRSRALAKRTQPDISCAISSPTHACLCAVVVETAVAGANLVRKRAHRLQHTETTRYSGTRYSLPFVPFLFHDMASSSSQRRETGHHP